MYHPADVLNRLCVVDDGGQYPWRPHQAVERPRENHSRCNNDTSSKSFPQGRLLVRPLLETCILQTQQQLQPGGTAAQHVRVVLQDQSDHRSLWAHEVGQWRRQSTELHLPPSGDTLHTEEVPSQPRDRLQDDGEDRDEVGVPCLCHSMFKRLEHGALYLRIRNLGVVG